MGAREELRRAYAEAIVRSAGGQGNTALLQAFARVPREDFLGPPPWWVLGAGPRGPTSDPADLYQDALVALLPGRGLNNGQPSLHARCLAELAPQPGETAIHVGAGGGYYTAILAELLGPTGRLWAYEIEPALARRAALALAPWPWVELRAQSALEGELPACDLLYASAGLSFPPRHWLDALRPGGRLQMPLLNATGRGLMLGLRRVGPTRFAARLAHWVAFVRCEDAQDAAAEPALSAALLSQPPEAVRSLRIDEPPDASAWCVTPAGWLSRAPAEP